MSSKLRRTKIIATLGPATDKNDELKKCLIAGVNLVRVNFSHGLAEDHIRRIADTRKLAKELNLQIGILVDLQGPKIRIARFKNGKVQLKAGELFCLDPSLDDDAGDEKQVGIDYKDLPKDVKTNDRLILADGIISMIVQKIENNKITCLIETDGELSNNKGINREGGGLSAEALTEKDKTDLKIAVDLDVDYIAISFPRNAENIHKARELITQNGDKNIGIIAKIERVEAVEKLDEIIVASNGIMVARGDLGVEVGDEELPGIQKKLIQHARTLDKPVITATQMMESMINNPIPTRAEVFDVANAVLDTTDAVMLSAETATSDHPSKVIETMARICLGAERQRSTQVSGHRVECHFNRVDEAIAMATMYTANHLDVKAIIALTESGSTPLWMSRIRSGIPIFGLSRHVKTLGRMTLYRGVYPLPFDIMKYSREEIKQEAIKTLKETNYIFDGDLVILTKGDTVGARGDDTVRARGTNSMKIIEVQSKM